MPQPRTVAVLVGSLRKDSFSGKVAQNLVDLAPDHLRFDFVGIGDLALYNEDLETETPPESWRAYRDAIRPVDALLFVTPEYNRSMPGGLKNALDVGSRPFGHSVYAKKPAAVVSVTPGALGGFGANHHLRQSCVFLDIPMMPQPEAYLAGVGKWFDGDGRIVSDETGKFLLAFMAAYADWIEKILRGPGELA